LEYKLIDFNVFGDDRGSLISLEGNKNIPFDIKRVYYIYDTKPEVTRGKHAHKDLEQVIVCLNGSCKFLLDNGKEKHEVELTRPDRALYIGKNMWREMMHFSYGCVLLVLANEYYCEKEYIRNYEEFLRLV
jgi:dTDP-4-dehydrorhamnose 3,5-epimerase-like enzyme